MYKDLTEIEKIPLRVERAKIIASQLLKKGYNLKKTLKWCIENEQYCAAEGIKQVLQENNLTDK